MSCNCFPTGRRDGRRDKMPIIYEKDNETNNGDAKLIATWNKYVVKATDLKRKRC